MKVEVKMKTFWYETFIRHRGKRYPAVRCSNCEMYFCDIVNNHSVMYKYCPYCGKRIERMIGDTKNE